MEHITESHKSSFMIIEIDNSKKAAIAKGKWSNPGAKMYDQLLNAVHSKGDVPAGSDEMERRLKDGSYADWTKLLKEAYAVAPVKDINNSPHGVTPFSRSGCKYPHHVIKGNKLVVSIPGLRAAYITARNQGVLVNHTPENKAIVAHFNRHFRELGLKPVWHHGEFYLMEECEVKIEENFNKIYQHIQERTGINLFESTIEDDVPNEAPSDPMSVIRESMEFIERFIQDDLFRESFTVNNTRDLMNKIKTPEQLMQWMDCIKYGWIDKSGKVCGTGENDDENHFYDEYRLQVAHELISSKVGVCWDQTELERQWFLSYKLPNPELDGKETLVPFIVLYMEIEDGENCPSHTTLIYKHPGSTSEVKWFEHSWDQYRGIHTYPTLKECITDIMMKFKKSHYDTEHSMMLKSVGLPDKWKDCRSCEEYMNLCHNGENIDLGDLAYDEVFGEGYIFEKSHGKLKFDFRIATDKKTGHKLKIIYSLDNIQVTGIGEYHRQYNSKDKIDPRVNVQDIQKDIRKLGNTDHQSKGQKVLAIIDLITGEHLKEAEVGGAYADLSDKKSFHVKVGEIENDPNFKSTFFDLKGNLGTIDDMMMGLNRRQLQPIGRGVKLRNVMGVGRANKVYTAKEALDYLNLSFDWDGEIKKVSESLSRVTQLLSAPNAEDDWMYPMMKKSKAEASVQLFEYRTIAKYKSTHQPPYNESDGKALANLLNQHRENRQTPRRSLYESTSTDEMLITEDRYFKVLKSELDEDFTPNGTLDLSNFNKTHITKELTKKYKDQGKLIKWMRDQDPKYDDTCWIWVDEDGDYVGAVTYDSKPDENGHVFISGIDIAYKYAGYGLGKQMLEEAIRDGANALNVQIDNEIAIKMYRDRGFRVSEESQKEVDSGKSKTYEMYLDESDIEDAPITEKVYGVAPPNHTAFTMDTLPRIMYFASAHRHPTVQNERVFLTPYIGIASIFIINTSKVIAEEYKKQTGHLPTKLGCNTSYKEWEMEGADLLKPLKKVHVRHNIPTMPDTFTGRSKGYIHCIDITDIRDQLKLFSSKDPDREVYYDGGKPLKPVEIIEHSLKWEMSYSETNAKYHGTGIIERTDIIPPENDLQWMNERGVNMPVIDIDERIISESWKDPLVKLMSEKSNNDIGNEPIDPEDESSKKTEKIDKDESGKNGKRRKKLYEAFIEYCKGINNKNAFGNIFDKDAFKVTYPFVPNEMRYFYRLANPMLCVLENDLTFFPVSQLKKINGDTVDLDKMIIFAGTEQDIRVFNKEDKKVYMGIEDNGQIVLQDALADSFDEFIQDMIGKGDILNESADDIWDE